MAKNAATARGAGTQSSMPPLVGILALIALLLVSYGALWAGHVAAGTGALVPGDLV
ncbi:hypothetical protein [Rhodococcus sp. MEB064]|uniref:hypothetical protein n=1 Tax=Rhodococcus sp. MEB064 TaxID=1587522 RepID=UPI0012E03BC3|nr:hypothetical protein [Rhodococcus sp. MEB064]